MRGVCGKWSGTHAELLAVVEALNRLLDLDLAIIEDAYQYEFLQRQKRAERLIAIGQMSGGIAHELRNPLNVVRTSVFYLRNARHITPEKQNEHLLRIERQVTVADAVITALSDFAKLPLPQFQPVAVRTLIDGTLLNLTIPPGTEVLVQCGGDVPPIQGDVRQLMIVLSNLVRNAVDAMPHGGRLTIRAVEGAAEVALSVTDSGAGIAIEDQRRIFEPFFSTKTRGIGLGLAISRAIVENHRGKLHVTSRPGEGSCFTISLPVASVP